MPNQAYRLRIRNAADSADALVLTSIAGGTNPYIASPPSGDGQEVDLLTGAVRTGAYVVEVVDVATGSDATGTIRILTNQLNDSSASTGRPHLLSRRAFVEMSTDGGSSWTAWCAGYISNIRQIDAIRYAVTVSNTRRVEQTERVFTWQSKAERDAFPKRGCIFGGPIIGGLGGGTARTIDSGGWTYQYKATTGTSTPVAGDTLALSYVSGAFYPLFEQKKVPGPSQNAQWWRSIKPYLKRVSGDASASGAAFTYLQGSEVFAMPDLTAIVTDPATGNQWLGEVRAINLGPAQAVAAESRLGLNDQNIYVKLYAPDTTWPTLPSANTALRVRVVTRQVAEASPVYIQTHPADLAKKLYEIINIPVNTAAYNAVVAALGANLRVTYRITAAQTMAEFLEQSVFGPFGFAARINGSGEVEFFPTRVLNYVAPTYTIGTNDIVGDEPPTIYDLDEGTVVTGFTLTQSVLTAMTNFDSDDTAPAPDGMMATEQTLEYASGDTSTYSTRVVSYNVPGMVTDAESFVSTFTDWSRGVVLEGFNRFGRGAVNSEVAVLRTASAAAAQVGDFVYLDASYYPNRNYRIGESSVGSRVAQVVRREERPEAVVFKLVDAGGFVQPGTAATVSLAISTADPRRVAQFTITNAATLNSGNIGVAVEWATGSSAPTGNGNLFTRYAPGSVPTGAVQLPAVKLGATKVYVRVRSEVPGIFPSAWSGWETVTLNAWTAPTGVTVGTLTNETAAVSWSLNTNTTDAVDVYVAPGSVAPSDWTPYRVNTLPEGTTSTLLTGLSASTAYIVGVAFRDRVANVAMTPVTATFTTAGTTTGTALRPAGVAIVPGVNDVALAQGIIVGLWSATGEETIVVERSTALGGPYIAVAVLPTTAELFIDYLPKDGAAYYYRLRHRTNGKADSAVTPVVSSTATGIPSTVARPAAIAPTITPQTTGESTQVSVTVIVDDPQNRVDVVQFRTSYHGGAYTAWTTDSTVPYSASVNVLNDGIASAVGWRILGYDNDGVYYDGTTSALREGESKWPLNLGVNPTVNKLTRSRYNSGTGKYEIWYRFYIELGNDELLEDPVLGFVTTSGPVPASIIDQNGTVATGLYYDPIKQTDGWRVEWNSTASQQWTFELASYGTYEDLIFPYQDSDVQTTPFPVTTGSATFVVPAASASATTGTLTLGTYLTGGSYNGSSNVTTTVDATSTNTASKVVARDASGNFAAGTISAALSGNATTATTLQTARNINGVSFNGSADITVTAAAGTLTGTTLASGVTASSLTSVGTIGTGVWQGSAVGVSYGGTGATSYGTTGSGTRAIVYDIGTNVFEAVPAGASGQFLQSAGTTGDITWATPPNFSTTGATAGYVPGSNGVGTSYFLRADGTWAVPSAGSVSANNVTAGTFSGANYYFTNNVRFDSGARVGYGYGYTIDNVSGTPVSVLTATTLGSGVTSSSLTSVGSLLGLTIASGNNISMTAGDVQMVSNAGYGILSADGTRAIAVTNAGTTILDGLFVGTAGSGNTIVTNSLGSVGIGIVPTTYKLDVNGELYVRSTGVRFPDGTLQSTAFTGASSQWTTSGSNIYYNTGNVGIGTTSPGSRLSVVGSTNGALPLVDLTASGTDAFMRGVRMLNSGMVNGSSLMYAVGRSDNARNMGQFYFAYVGDGSTSNRISMGLHSVDDVLNILGTGNVGIGTTSPAAKLSVNGGATIGGDISTTGQGRFTGWYTGNAATGLAAEIGMSGGEGYVMTYNRDNATWGTINLQSSSANFRLSGGVANLTSGALQQGGNQVLHAGNYTSYSPSLTGSGASGTWGISITGTSASTDLINSVGVTGNLDSMYQARTFGWEPSTTGRPTDQYGQGIAVVSTGNTHNNTNNWITQLGFGTNMNTAYFRTKVNTGAWGAWRELLHSNNYSSYALPLSGGTVTGNLTVTGQWINSGNSGTNTGLAIYNANGNDDYGVIRNYQSGTNYQTIHFFSSSWQGGSFAGVSAGAINISGYNGVTFGSWNDQAGRIDNSGNLWVKTSASVAGNTVLHAGNYSSYALPLSGGTVTGVATFNGGGTNASIVIDKNIASPSNYYNGLQMEVRATSGVAGISLHRNGYSHVGIYHDSTNELKFNMSSGTVTMPYNVGTVAGSGNVSGLQIMHYAGFTLDANTMPSNSTGFTYQNNAPYYGPVARFSTNGGYDLWLNAPYIGGNDLAYRTRNGDNGTLNPWKYILNTSNYTSYAPSLTGSGASGTWSINVTGTAGSAPANGGTATALNGSNYISRTGSSGNYNTDFNNTPAGTVRHLGDDPNIANSPGGTWWFVDNYRHSNSGNYWGTQIAWGWEDNARRLCQRNVTGGNWSSWVEYLNNSNYSSYALPLSGGTLTGDLRLNTRLGFTGSGNAGDGFPYARLVEAWGIAYQSPDNRWTFSTSNSLLVGMISNGSNFGAGNVIATGNVTAYYSDERLKTNLGRIERALEKVRSLEGFRYVENELARSFGYTTKEPQLGLSAQAVQRIAPEVVSLAPFDMTGDGKVDGDGKIYSKSGEHYLTVDYSRLVPLLIEAVKELADLVEGRR